MTPMAYAWTLFSGASIIKRRLTWTNDDPFAGSEVYGDVYQVVGVPLYTEDECKARAEATEKQLEDYIEVEEVNRSLVKRGDHYKAKAEAAEKRVKELEAALATAIVEWENSIQWEWERDEIVPVRAVLEAKP